MSGQLSVLVNGHTTVPFNSVFGFICYFREPPDDVRKQNGLKRMCAPGLLTVRTSRLKNRLQEKTITMDVNGIRCSWVEKCIVPTDWQPANDLLFARSCVVSDGSSFR